MANTGDSGRLGHEGGHDDAVGGGRVGTAALGHVEFDVLAAPVVDLAVQVGAVEWDEEYGRAAGVVVELGGDQGGGDGVTAHDAGAEHVAGGTVDGGEDAVDAAGFGFVDQRVPDLLAGVPARVRSPLSSG